MLSKDLNRRVKNSLIEASTDEYPTLTKEQRIAALELSVDDVTSGALARLLALEAMIPTVAAEGPNNYHAATGVMVIDEGVSLNFTSKAVAAIGNNTKVLLIDPEADNTTIDVEVSDYEIHVTLARTGAAITSTVANVKAAIEAKAEAHALVGVTITGTTSTVIGTVPELLTLASGIDATKAAAAKMIIAAGKLYVAVKEIDAFDIADGWVLVGPA
ncbi:MAG TPA: hypothetical protein PKI15_04655 [Candidatus Cloacimonadota bacterium]|nr:hypothetical protein [Candidatus Cloacimonadota bacterium]